MMYQTINNSLPTSMISSLPTGMMLQQIGAKTKEWAGGINISLHMPGEGTRTFRYDFQQSIWFEQPEFGCSMPISAAAVREIVERIFIALQ
jgi:hypothetical protein